MDIIIAIVLVVGGLMWILFWRRVGNAVLSMAASVLRIEKQLLSISQGTGSKEALEQLKGLRSDLSNPRVLEPPKNSAPESDEYFYSDDTGKTRGPYTASQMRAFFRQGIVRCETPVSAGEDSDWTSYEELLA